MDLLAARQFPDEQELPDGYGYFSRARPFSDENPLRIQDCEITNRQIRQLKGESVDGEDESAVVVGDATDHSPCPTDMGTLTQTEVDQCFSLDMEPRPHSSSPQQSTIAPPPLGLSQLIDEYSVTPAGRVGQSTPVQAGVASSLDVSAGLLVEQEEYPLCTQNVTADSIENIEKWLASSAGGGSQLSTITEESPTKKNKKSAKDDSYSVSDDSGETPLALRKSTMRGNDARVSYGRGRLRSGKLRYTDEAHGDAVHSAGGALPLEQDLLTQPQAAYEESDGEGKVEVNTLHTRSQRVGQSGQLRRGSRGRRGKARDRDGTVATPAKRPLEGSTQESAMNHSAIHTQPSSSYALDSTFVTSDVAESGADFETLRFINKVVGQKVRKKFMGYGWFNGKVTSYSR